MIKKKQDLKYDTNAKTKRYFTKITTKNMTWRQRTIKDGICGLECFRLINVSVNWQSDNWICIKL